jgi:dihydrolipoamide dehydrogenase
MQQHDLVVIGGGPGGYAAAVRAARLGMSVGLVEQEAKLGGTCLRVGCIPSKALLESSEHLAVARDELAKHGIRVAGVELDLGRMLARKDEVVAMLARGVDGLVRNAGVVRYQGHGRLVGPGRVAVEGEAAAEIEAKHVLIATGSKTKPLPGVAIDGERIGTSTEALAYGEVPARFVVIGAGAIGLELGSVWARLGAQVVVLEYLERVLPGFDAEIAAEAHKILGKQGLQFRLGARVTAARVADGQCVVECEGIEPIVCDRVLVATGRVPNTDGLGLEAAGIVPDAQGRIPVDARFATAAAGVFAIGDVIAGPMLAHKAEAEGVACAEMLAGGWGGVDYDAIPNVVYTSPEVAAVGKSEDELAAAGIAFRKGISFFRANGRAQCLGQTSGKVKVLSDAATDRLLGVHVVGPRAGDLIAEAAVAIAFHASAEDLARACHAHPTLAEALKEAAAAAVDAASRRVSGLT